MATRSANTHRFDPYKNFKFRVKFGGRIVAGVSRVTGLTAAARKLRGLRKYPNLTLKRGMTRDAAFRKWMTSRPRTRKDIVVEIYDADGTFEKAYKVSRGWISKVQAPDLSAGANDVGIETLTLEHEGLTLTTRRRA
jgi:phage tail-like protein